MPGPPFIPFKGNIDFILEAGGLHAAYDAWSKKYGPVFKIFLGSEPVVVLTDAAAVRTSSLRLATRPPFRAPAELRFEKGAAALHAGDMLQTPSVRFHGELKKAWLPFFAAPSLRAHAPAIGALTDRLAERLTQAAREGREIDVTQFAGAWTADLVFKLAFNLDLGAQDDAPPADAAAFVDAARKLFTTQQRSTRYFAAYAAAPPVLRPLVRVAATLFPDAPLLRVGRARELVLTRMRALLAEARARAAAGHGLVSAPKTAGSDGVSARGCPTGSFFDLLVASRIAPMPGAPPRPLSDAECVQSAFTMALAAFDTTAGALSFAIYNLATAPDVSDALATEAAAVLAEAGDGAPPPLDVLASAPLLRAVINETLRLYPPGALTTRIADGVVAPGGVRLPKGTWVHSASWSLQRDEKVWGPDAAEFRPARFPRQRRRRCHISSFVPFGASASALACVGKRLALAELQVALAALFGQAGLRFTLSPGQTPLALHLPLTLGAKHGCVGDAAAGGRGRTPAQRARAQHAAAGGGGGGVRERERERERERDNAGVVGEGGGVRRERVLFCFACVDVFFVFLSSSPPLLDPHPPPPTPEESKE